MEIQSDGEPLKIHLESLLRQSGVLPQQLAEAPELPVLCSHVWNAFVELHNERQNYGRLRLADIREWTQTVGMRLENWELAAIRRLDAIWLKAQNEHRCGNPSPSS